MRADREDLRQQQEAVREARQELVEALRDLGVQANLAAKTLARPSLRGNPDLTDVYAAHRVVARCEENLDLALLDLRTARGEDA